MTPLPTGLCLCVLWIFVTVTRGNFVDLPLKDPILSLAEEETLLPCRYTPTGDNMVVQVTWYKQKQQIITAHHVNGQTAFGTWSQRVRFKSSEPTLDASLVIMSTEVSDEGKYFCRISTFPSGNFDRDMSVVVWTVPISSLDPVVLVEGQSYRQAASCRSVARPPPRLTWDTELNGQAVDRSSDNGAVSSHYSLHPLRNMNGKTLDCLVWHPTMTDPRRLTNKLVVHCEYGEGGRGMLRLSCGGGWGSVPPHAEVSGFNGDWVIGLENAALRCVSGGNPKPQSFTWIRYSRPRPLHVCLLHVCVCD
ncbi:Nectin-4 [Liparis tanakae]|uniref:Nectin-4 n=1 Tax=Liparis tanakae TaxID=230148 RepID=A0A4Z2EYZ0_9TELE|nr:Nectin-4 [Liparis tanakae]